MWDRVASIYWSIHSYNALPALVGICATARLPGRLEKDHLPFYFTPSPDDRDEHVEQFTPEEKKERQQVRFSGHMAAFSSHLNRLGLPSGLCRV